ncbi:uncharacterized protein BDV14DRAFT_203074 [Aspergillus stella-maris]|uniref:uncharacterized protein n=1 Tax=Aspergillus stella-maris TaxID=1810926 RepID=UPI003CCD13AE
MGRTREIQDHLKYLYNDKLNNIRRESFWLQMGGQTSGISIRWWDMPEQRIARIGVKGLTGCTVVLILSYSGVWVGHMWEDPIFGDVQGLTDMGVFQASTFDAFQGTILGNEGRVFHHTNWNRRGSRAPTSLKKAAGHCDLAHPRGSERVFQIFRPG